MKRITLGIFVLFTISLLFATSALAYSHNSISNIVNVQNNGQYFSIGEIRFSEDRQFDDHFQNGDVFTIALSSGISWNPESVVDAAYADIRLVSDRVLEVTMKNCEDGVTDSIILKGLQIKVDSNFTGDIKLEIDGRDSAITSSKSISGAAAPTKQYYNEAVTVLMIFDDFSALIGRENGEQYIVETEVPLGLWTLQRKPVIVLSPSSFFAGPGAYLQVPSGNQSLIIDVIQLNSKATNTGYTNSGKINIFINGEEVSFDTQPIVDAGITLVPLRGIMEKLGAEVTYYGASETIMVTKGTQEISLKIGELQAKVNDKIVNLQLPAQVVNKRTLVPLRFISESLGATVDYNKQEGFISIY
ncbi:copper amine oxidase N-terminal domain-containing protein [Desulfotomaculum sp. 1211_IL3151]|uniref:copper amine oxidase N-terminal domain-containing protein n=1 Tax=Desulfotomaculum sp. 1211_IL3151 TaxID=3084055 RepID=UPI002FD95082